jgi:hypothetical protein
VDQPCAGVERRATRKQSLHSSGSGHRSIIRGPTLPRRRYSGSLFPARSRLKLDCETSQAHFLWALDLEPSNKIDGSRYRPLSLNQKKWDERTAVVREIAVDPQNARLVQRGLVVWSKWYPARPRTRASLNAPEEPGDQAAAFAQISRRAMGGARGRASRAERRWRLIRNSRCHGVHESSDSRTRRPARHGG